MLKNKLLILLLCLTVLSVPACCETVVWDLGSIGSIASLPDADLLSRLADMEPIIRAAAAREIGSRKYVAAIPQLRGLLSDDVPFVRMEAASALLEMGDLSVIGTLRELLNAKHTGTALRAARALARHGDESGFDLAKSNLHSTLSLYRTHAMEILSCSSDVETAYSVLKQGVADADMRWVAVELLGKRSDARSIALLAGLCNDDRSTMRLHVARNLANTGSADVVPILLGMLGDSDIGVVNATLTGLGRLTGRSVAFPTSASDARTVQENWMKWWTENGAQYHKEEAETPVEQ